MSATRILKILLRTLIGFLYCLVLLIFQFFILAYSTRFGHAEIQPATGDMRCVYYGFFTHNYPMSDRCRESIVRLAEKHDVPKTWVWCEKLSSEHNIGANYQYPWYKVARCALGDPALGEALYMGMVDIAFHPWRERRLFHDPTIGPLREVLQENKETGALELKEGWEHEPVVYDWLFDENSGADTTSDVQNYLRSKLPARPIQAKRPVYCPIKTSRGAQ